MKSGVWRRRKSRLWKQMQADIFGTPITTINSRGPAWRGFAGGSGNGHLQGWAEACDTAIIVEEVQQPDMTLMKIHGILQAYGQLYKSLQGL